MWFGVYHYLPTPPQPSLCLPFSAPLTHTLPAFYNSCLFFPLLVCGSSHHCVFLCPLLSGQLRTFSVQWDYTCLDFFFFPLVGGAPRRAANPLPLVHTCQLQLRHGQSSFCSFNRHQCFYFVQPLHPPHPTPFSPLPLCAPCPISPPLPYPLLSLYIRPLLVVSGFRTSGG